MTSSSKTYLSKICSAGVFAGGMLFGAVVMPVIQHHPAYARMMLTETKPAASSPAVAVTPHRAVYDFKMVAVESAAGISGIRGKMYYEQDDACDAFTTEHRFNAEYQYPERAPVITTSQYSSWEAKAGRQFYFNSDRQDNGILSEQLRGSVQQGGEGKADTGVYSRPEALSYNLPEGYYLPVAHTHEIIARAQRGETFFNAVVFDGTDADGPVEISTFIGNKATTEEISAVAAQQAKIEDATVAKDMPVKIEASLLAPEAWHVRLAVFPLKNETEMLPAYEMDMLLHANGVASKVVIDYRIFKVAQTLTALEPIKPRQCP